MALRVLSQPVGVDKIQKCGLGSPLVLVGVTQVDLW